MKIGNQVTNPGELDTKITICSPIFTEKSGGAYKKSWNDVDDDIWSKWVGVHGSEAWAASANNAIRAATVTIRYRADIDETWALKKDGQYYEIISMDDIRNHHEYIELKVKWIRPG
jgi:SPP1 family predicted phage head-tail adaptor